MVKVDLTMSEFQGVLNTKNSLNPSTEKKEGYNYEVISNKKVVLLKTEVESRALDYALIDLLNEKEEPKYLSIDELLCGFSEGLNSTTDDDEDSFAEDSSGDTGILIDDEEEFYTDDISGDTGILVNDEDAIGVYFDDEDDFYFEKDIENVDTTEDEDEFYVYEDIGDSNDMVDGDDEEEFYVDDGDSEDDLYVNGDNLSDWEEDELYLGFTYETRIILDDKLSNTEIANTYTKVEDIEEDLDIDEEYGTTDIEEEDSTDSRCADVGGSKGTNEDVWDNEWGLEDLSVESDDIELHSVKEEQSSDNIISAGESGSDSEDISDLFSADDISEDLYDIKESTIVEKQPEAVEIKEEKPKDLRAYVKKNKGCSIQEVVDLYSKRELDSAMSLGRVYTRSGKLYVS
jgi:hypothetical protein